jgi:tetratricopeptide (TPR) repeat protein
MIQKAVQVFNSTLEYTGGAPELQEEIIDYCLENEVDAYAAKLLENLIITQPNRSDLLFKLGKTFEKLGEPSRAVTHLTRASQIDKGNIDIKIHLAKSYLNLKKPFLAERPLREIINANPNNELAQELLRQCV